MTVKFLLVKSNQLYLYSLKLQSHYLRRLYNVNNVILCPQTLDKSRENKETSGRASEEGTLSWDIVCSSC